MADEIPVLTIRQPWCWAIVYGQKPVENRSWNMKYRGPLFLHAGARSRWDPAGADSHLVQAAWLRETGIPDVPHGTARDIGLHRNSDRITFGAVTSLAVVTGCHHSGECMFPASQELHGVRSGCSPWAARGQWHMELSDIRPLHEPVPCRGMLGLWRLPEDAEAAVRAQLEDGDA